MQVLVVDDDPLVRATHERWLASLGIRVYGVSTFKEAIDHIVIKKPDYVLTDYQLPGEEIVRFLDLLPQDLEVIVVSGRSQSGIRKQLSAYGNVKAILEKPISKSQLRDLLFSVEDGVIGNLLARKIA
jgi:CheY-like chemotaxis protein